MSRYSTPATLAALALGALAATPFVLSEATAQGRGPQCRRDNAQIVTADSFCALMVADSVGRARHLVVAPNGDVLVAIARARGQGATDSGGVLVLRDTTGDGVADLRIRFGTVGGTGIALVGDYLYFAPDDGVLRWRWAGGQTQPSGAPDTVVWGLTNRRTHASKAIAISKTGDLYVNIGAPSNACQPEDRSPGVPGQDPCPLLEVSGGIWRFRADRVGQTQADGQRFATGLRNVIALDIEPSTGKLYGVQHGRDDLARLWPGIFGDATNAEGGWDVSVNAGKPAEELFQLNEGWDYGWPYCYYDPELRQKVLSPEYGGDGKTAGRCQAIKPPLAHYPAHWAPNAMAFYTGSQFPAQYRGGAFIAFHGSWNRVPRDRTGYKQDGWRQEGFRVVFQAFANGVPSGEPRSFASGFEGGEPITDPARAAHRPTGVAVGPDGSVYVSDDQAGRIYRILYRPGEAATQSR